MIVRCRGRIWKYWSWRMRFKPKSTRKEAVSWISLKNKSYFKISQASSRSWKDSELKGNDTSAMVVYLFYYANSPSYYLYKYKNKKIYIIWEEENKSAGGEWRGSLAGVVVKLIIILCKNKLRKKYRTPLKLRRVTISRWWIASRSLIWTQICSGASTVSTPLLSFRLLKALRNSTKGYYPRHQQKGHHRPGTVRHR